MSQSDEKVDPKQCQDYKDNNPIIARVDRKLGEYYKQKNRNDYYIDKDQKFGKFLIWAQVQYLILQSRLFLSIKRNTITNLTYITG